MPTTPAVYTLRSLPRKPNLTTETQSHRDEFVAGPSPRLRASVVPRPTRTRPGCGYWPRPGPRAVFSASPRLRVPASSFFGDFVAAVRAGPRCLPDSSRCPAFPRAGGPAVPAELLSAFVPRVRRPRSPPRAPEFYRRDAEILNSEPSAPLRFVFPEIAMPLYFIIEFWRILTVTCQYVIWGVEG